MSRRTDQPFTAAYSLTRMMPADPHTVFSAWTTSEGLARWFGPDDVDVPAERITMEARPGGSWRVVMVAPDGNETSLGGQVREVDSPRRLVITTGDPANTTGDMASVVTLQLVAVDDGTSLHFQQAGVNTSSAHAEQAKQGWLSLLDRLASHVAR